MARSEAQEHPGALVTEPAKGPAIRHGERPAS